MLDAEYGNDAGEKREEVAAKLLKIYDPEVAKNEYKLHTQASGLISAHEKEGGEIAKIPQIYDIVDITTDSEKIKTLIKRTNTSSLKENVSVLVMEFIPGKTFARYIYEQVIKRHPKLVHLKDVASELSMSDIQENIATALEFKIPGGKHTDLGMKIFEQEKVFGENIKKLVEYLGKTDFVLPETILNKVKNTVQLLHNNHFFHRDLHEKNIMITETHDGEVDDIFLIDFGLSIIDTDNDKQHNPYQNPLTGEQYMADETIHTRYAALAYPEHVRRNAEKQNTKKKLGDLKLRILKRYPDLFEHSRENGDSISDIDLVAREMARTVSGKSVGDLFNEVQAFIVVELCKEKKVPLLNYFEFISGSDEYKGRTPFIKMIQDMVILEAM